MTPELRSILGQAAALAVFFAATAWVAIGMGGTMMSKFLPAFHHVLGGSAVSF